ncbi:MAG: DUF924 domain-containing protein [Deltaproteobacteria bacterium]|nr:DUF924 domain-containing protein [Deltaproteobacteria bacterium]
MIGPSDVLDFWFGDLDESGSADAEHSKQWFKKDPEFDAEIRTRFESSYQAIASGEREDWLSKPEGALAYVIVLDQFSRNMYRDSAQMYAADDRALTAARQAITAGFDAQLPSDQRVFLYMPLMHAEDREAQAECVSHMEKLVAELGADPDSRAAANLKYARWHQDVVDRFGRFPHRNPILGREHTPEEQSYLDEGGHSF